MTTPNAQSPANIAAHEAVRILEQYPANASEMRIVYLDAVINRQWEQVQVIGSALLNCSLLVAARRSIPATETESDSLEYLVILPVAANDTWSPFELCQMIPKALASVPFNTGCSSIWLGIVATDASVVYYQIDSPTSISPATYHALTNTMQH